ncbi:MAG: hypothetical protein ACJAWY_002891, partial [Sphingomonas echinoides]
KMYDARNDSILDVLFYSLKTQEINHV